MIVVQELVVAQNFRFIPRYGSPTTLTLIDENTNVAVPVVTFTFFVGGYDFACSAVLPVEENHFYWAIFKNAANEVILKERMFCTNQNIDTFSVNNGGYVSNVSTNDFIMYE